MTKETVRIGVDLGGTKIEIIVLDSANKILLRQRRPTPRDDYQETIDTIADMIWQTERELAISAHIGVCMPGSLSPATGLVRNANSTWLNGRPLDKDLCKRLGREVRFANDADCFALSEATDGSAAESKLVFGVIIGTGVGGGVVLDGRIVAGRNGVTGEWGHNQLPWFNPETEISRSCYCGKSGCIETFLAGPSLSWHHAQRYGEHLLAPEIVRRAQGDDAECAHSMSIYSDQLARGLASVINLLDPEIIVLGGGMSNVSQLYKDVPAILPRYVFSDTMQTQIKAPVHGDSSGVRGAAMLWDS